MKSVRCYLAVPVFAALAACATTYANGDNGKDKDGIYYNSQAEADAALAQFDKDNPSCQLWTNWQKMCSRTGESGTTECGLDGKYRASPSRPFCVGKQRSGNVSEFLDPADKENLSRSRFCDRYEKSNGKARCITYKKGRPFNGYNLSGRLHSWCARWDDAITSKPICQSDNKDPDVQDCASLKHGLSESQHGFVCGRTNIPSWCQWSEGFGYGTNGSSKNEDFLPLAEKQEARPVHGIYCRRSK